MPTRPGQHDPPNGPRPRTGRSQGGAGLLPREQAAVHRRTRRAHRVETAEDYVELIAALIQEEGEARVTDLARRLGVSHVTVGRTIARLQRDGWVTAKPYRAIFLTDAGRRLAEQSERRHRLVVEFLRALGVSERSAQRDAEGIEHHVGDETLAAFARFVSGSD